MTVQQQIDITVKQPAGPVPRLKPCSKMSKTVTWKSKYPRGFWSTGNKWTSLICHQHDLRDTWVRECLRDTTVWLFGDSNTKQIYKALLRWVPCSGSGRKQLDLHFCFEKEHKINITYIVHENTVYSNKTRDLPTYTGLERYVDLIPNSGRQFVIFHYFLHPSRAHPSALYFRLKKVKEMILKLLARNPSIHIAVRGPHISSLQTLRNHMLGGDVLGIFMKALFNEMFHDLRDKIVFLDGWDLTVAIRNTEYHPIPQVAEELTRTFLAFKCE